MSMTSYASLPYFLIRKPKSFPEFEVKTNNKWKGLHLKKSVIFRGFEMKNTKKVFTAYPENLL